MDCDRADCFTMCSTLVMRCPLYSGQNISQIGPEACNGCRQCMRLCQFGALGYSAGTQKAVVDQHHCYGCGICRSVCSAQAILLDEDRRSSSTAVNLW